MTQKWFISDTHFNHANFLKFRDENGQLIRPFKDLEEMNELMIENWNKTVGEFDKIYHLGDVALGDVKDFNNIMRRLNGKKTLIIGNHDRFDNNTYSNWFRKIKSWQNFQDGPVKFIATHAPLHEESFFPKRAFVNVHGHIHEKHVWSDKDREVKDTRYLNVCVEHWNYTPIPIEDIFEYVRKYK